MAIFAKQIAFAYTEERVNPNDAFTAGLLHDIGQLVLAANVPERYGQVFDLMKPGNLSFDACERQIFGTSHAEIGAYLLGLWGLPNPIVEAAAFHHHPGLCQGNRFTALSAVHIANALEQELLHSNRVSSTAVLDEEYLTRIGVKDYVPEWRDLCYQTTTAAAA